MAWAADLGVAPIADWIILSGQWDESRRDDGLRIDFALIERADELWQVGGRVSEGMALEAREAEVHGVVVFDLTALGEEPLRDLEKTRAIIEEMRRQAEGLDVEDDRRESP